MWGDNFLLSGRGWFNGGGGIRLGAIVAGLLWLDLMQSRPLYNIYYIIYSFFFSSVLFFQRKKHSEEKRNERIVFVLANSVGASW